MGCVVVLVMALFKGLVGTMNNLSTVIWDTSVKLLVAPQRCSNDSTDTKYLKHRHKNVVKCRMAVNCDTGTTKLAHAGGIKEIKTADVLHKQVIEV